MTTIDLQARKATLVRDILNLVDSEEAIAKLERLIDCDTIYIADIWNCQRDNVIRSSHLI